jgi:flagellin
MQKFNTSSIKAGVSTDTAAQLASKVFTINGNKFLAADTTLAAAATQRKIIGDDVTIIDLANTTGTAIDDADLDAVATEIERVTGMKTKTYAADATDTSGIKQNDIAFTEDTLKLGGSELSLQVGDTNADYQKVNVKIQDMSSAGLGLTGLNLSDQESAGNAIDTIKNAVNAVSLQRGQLGATQNRLDHTLNNLDATTQNITAAESQIRDVDMAKEMTEYSKNNILVQAAQSMLAQANSVPQGVLQLLG